MRSRVTTRFRFQQLEQVRPQAEVSFCNHSDTHEMIRFSQELEKEHKFSSLCSKITELSQWKEDNVSLFINFKEFWAFKDYQPLQYTFFANILKTQRVKELFPSSSVSACTLRCPLSWNISSPLSQDIQSLCNVLKALTQLCLPSRFKMSWLGGSAVM